MEYCHLAHLPISLTFLALREASPGPGGAEAAGAKASDAGRCGSGRFVEVGAHTTNVHPSGSKESPIAWFVAIRPSVVLCMPSWGQDAVAVLTFQAEWVPVLAQGAHFLCCGGQGGIGQRGARPSRRRPPFPSCSRPPWLLEARGSVSGRPAPFRPECPATHRWKEGPELVASSLRPQGTQ